MEKHLAGLVVPGVILVVSLPMILGKVGPNNIYGFRTRKTLSSREVWYPANRAAGWFTGAAAVLSICFNLELWRIVPEWPPDRIMAWTIGGTLVPQAMAVLAAFLYLRRL